MKTKVVGVVALVLACVGFVHCLPPATEPECSGSLTLSGSEGTVKSHVEAGSTRYGSLLDCQWFIRPPSCTVIVIKVEALAIEYGFDFLVFTPESGVSPPLNVTGRLPLALPKDYLVFLTSSLNVSFTTDDRDAESGFILEYWAGTCPDGCSGHGYCDKDSPATCLCDEGWEGDACTVYTGPLGCPLNCSYPNGECLYEAQQSLHYCSCSFGWMGAACEDEVCSTGMVLLEPSGTLLSSSLAVPTPALPSPLLCSWELNPLLTTTSSSSGTSQPVLRQGLRLEVLVLHLPSGGISEGRMATPMSPPQNNQDGETLAALAPSPSWYRRGGERVDQTLLPVSGGGREGEVGGRVSESGGRSGGWGGDGPPHVEKGEQVGRRGMTMSTSVASIEKEAPTGQRASSPSSPLPYLRILDPRSGATLAEYTRSATSLVSALPVTDTAPSLPALPLVTERAVGEEGPLVVVDLVSTTGEDVTFYASYTSFTCECVHGRCLAQDLCVCSLGYTGVTCETATFITTCPPHRGGSNCSVCVSESEGGGEGESDSCVVPSQPIQEDRGSEGVLDTGLVSETTTVTWQIEHEDPSGSYTRSLRIDLLYCAENIPNAVYFSTSANPEIGSAGVYTCESFPEFVLVPGEDLTVTVTVALGPSDFASRGLVLGYQLLSCPSSCSSRGTCVVPSIDTCVCAPPFSPPTCTTASTPLYCGKGTPVPSLGVCLCPEGYSGSQCERPQCGGAVQLRALQGSFADRAVGPATLPYAECAWELNPVGGSGLSTLTFEYNQLLGPNVTYRIEALRWWRFLPPTRVPLPVLVMDGASLRMSLGSQRWGGLVARYYDNSLCPSNCSFTGLCINGVCECWKATRGIDCSEPVEVPMYYAADHSVDEWTLSTSLEKKEWVYWAFVIEEPIPFSVTANVNTSLSERDVQFLVKTEDPPTFNEFTYSTAILKANFSVEFRIIREVTYYFALYGLNADDDVNVSLLFHYEAEETSSPVVTSPADDREDDYLFDVLWLGGGALLVAVGCLFVIWELQFRSKVYELRQDDIQLNLLAVLQAQGLGQGQVPAAPPAGAQAAPPAAAAGGGGGGGADVAVPAAGARVVAAAAGGGGGGGADGVVPATGARAVAGAEGGGAEGERRSAVPRATRAATATVAGGGGADPATVGAQRGGGAVVVSTAPGELNPANGGGRGGAAGSSASRSSVRQPLASGSGSASASVRVSSSKPSSPPTSSAPPVPTPATSTPEPTTAPGSLATPAASASLSLPLPSPSVSSSAAVTTAGASASAGAGGGGGASGAATIPIALSGSLSTGSAVSRGKRSSGRTSGIELHDMSVHG